MLSLAQPAGFTAKFLAESRALLALTYLTLRSKRSIESSWSTTGLDTSPPVVSLLSRAGLLDPNLHSLWSLSSSTMTSPTTRSAFLIADPHDRSNRSATFADKLQLRRDLPLERPGRGECLIKVHAVSLNYRDLIASKGQYPGCKKDVRALARAGRGPRRLMGRII